MIAEGVQRLRYGRERRLDEGRDQVDVDQDLQGAAVVEQEHARREPGARVAQPDHALLCHGHSFVYFPQHLQRRYRELAYEFVLAGDRIEFHLQELGEQYV